YAMFSLAPVLILLVAIAGLVYGQEAAQGQLAQQTETMFGPSAAQTIERIISSASAGGGGILAMILSIVLVLLGASAVFAQLQMSLNRIWDVQMAPEEGMWATVRQRLIGLAMVFGLGLLLIAMVVLGT
ncbi:MAG: YhjD/YihY/BrkB family envelope integrity protein, partial [Bradymonadaceae bacterium]